MTQDHFFIKKRKKVTQDATRQGSQILIFYWDRCHLASKGKVESNKKIFITLKHKKSLIFK